MGVFHDMIELVNRTSEPIDIMYDGQRHTLDPNYDEIGDPIAGVHNMVPRQVLPYALNQSVIMGSESFVNPGSFRSRIGVIDNNKKVGPKAKKYSWHDCSFIESVPDEVTRVSQESLLEEIADPKATLARRGKKQHAVEDAMFDANVPTPFDLQSRG